VAQAKKATQERQAPQRKWLGPTSSPAPQPGKTVVYIPTDAQNALSSDWGRYMQEAGRQVGWTVKIIDGKGTSDGWLAAFNQAIALRPDGIATSADVAALQSPVRRATRQGIPIVGLHGSALPGPNRKLNEFTNITSDPREIGRALADYVVAKSNGTAQATILYDAQYEIARYKADAMRDEFAKCSSCKLLQFANSPLAEVAQRTPQLFQSWLNQFGRSFWTMSIADYYYDFAVPALRSAAVPKDGVKLVGADGTQTAYQRIAQGSYQVATVPEPAALQAYQAIDEFNRAFHDQKPSGFVQPVYIVDASNLQAEGGDRQVFNPSNGFKQRYVQMWKARER
jgi:ribose transport system substrate-binding protein